jgi:hypothetical protein
VPPLDQITPEPADRLPTWIKTVERRGFSVISPNPATAISFACVRPFRNHDVAFLNGTATNEFQRKRFSDGVPN